LLYVFNFFKQLNIGIYNYKYIFFDYYKNKIVLLSFVYLLFILSIVDWGFVFGDFVIFNFQSPITIIFWGLGIGDWGLPNPQSPIPNPPYLI